MATTDPALARFLLETLDAESIEYVVLHNASDIAELKHVSDVDLVVRRHPREVVRQLGLAQDRLLLAMESEYDNGAFASFWLTPDGTEGVQLDLLCDPRGRGKYGFRTDIALRYRDDRQWPPRLQPVAEQAYVFVKRMGKGDRVRAGQAWSALIEHPGWEDCLNELVPSRRRWDAAVARGCLGGPLFARWVVLRGRLGVRGLRRLASPAGVIVVVPADDESAVTRVASDMRRVFVGVRVTRGESCVQRALDRAVIRRPVLIMQMRRGLPISAETSLGAHVVAAANYQAVRRVATR